MSGIWHYFRGDQSEILGWLWTTIWLAGGALLIGLAISLPLGYVAHRFKWTYPPLIGLSSLIYTVPSFVLLVSLPGLLGTGFLDPENVLVALTLYTVALLVRVVADGLSAVSADTLNAASAMGLTAFQRTLQVQLPLAVPVIGAGLRVAAVSDVSLISVASLIGVPQLGELFTIFSQGNTGSDPVFLGLIMIVAVALVFDLVILLAIQVRDAVAAGGALMAGPFGPNGLPKVSNVWPWLTTSAHWWGPEGLLARIREHMIYVGVAVLVAALIALPIGLLVGHTGRGVAVVAGLANVLRAIPALGLVVLLVFELSGHIHLRQQISGVTSLRGELRYLIPVEIVLVVLAIPPILTNTYAGVRNVDPSVRDAARGMGMTGAQVVRRVEFPCALPLIMSGLRSSVLQVIATATIAAYAPLVGGLGRLIIDGNGQLYSLTDGYPAMLGAAIVVAVLAVLADLVLALVQRAVVSPGLNERRLRTRGARARPQTIAEVTPVHSA